MKRLLLSTLLFFFLYLLSSCVSKQQEVFSEVSPNPPSIEQMKIWIGSKKDGRIGSEVGIMDYVDCYEFEKADDIKRNDFGDLDVFIEGIKPENILCEDIEGFDYEPGYIYLIQANRYFLGDESTGMGLDTVLLKEKDRNYIKIEEFDLLVDSKKSKSTAWTGQEIECLTVFYENNEKESEEWSTHCQGIAGFDYEPGYTYHIRVRRTHMSEFELSMLADHPGFSDSLVKVIAKIKDK